MTATTQTATPWADYSAIVGNLPASAAWDAVNWPYVVRWDVNAPHAVSAPYVRSHNRRFQTLAEAVTAYKRPFRGVSVDMVVYNGGAPRQHLTTLPRRQCGKPTKWSDAVSAELRA